jgi:hypothetical protein
LLANKFRPKSLAAILAAQRAGYRLRRLAKVKVLPEKESVTDIREGNDGRDSSLHPLQSFNDDTLLPSLPNGRNSGYVTVT